MKKTETRIYHNHLIIREEGTQFGVFFRSPIQKIYFDAYDTYNIGINSAWTYMSSIKNPVRRLYEILIGNRYIIDNIEKWSRAYNWAGFTANIIMSPIYFSRKFRKLKSVSKDTDDLIQEIISYGYEGPYNHCSGKCHVEKTRVTLKNGKRIRSKQKGQYYFTYKHIIEKVIRSSKQNWMSFSDIQNIFEEKK